MQQIDKEKFGTFISQLRREKGMTQKELAEKLFISDKAVSKWETGMSIPDTALLVPLSEIFGLSVNELLLCDRGNNIGDAKENPVNIKAPDGFLFGKALWKAVYPAAAILGGIGLFLGMAEGVSDSSVYCLFILSLIFGAYFCIFTKSRLPDYYDSNRISGVHEGPFRMNVPGLYFNNSNWPYIILVGRCWSCAVLCAYPWIDTVMSLIIPDAWAKYGLYVALIFVLGGLFVPMYIAGRKYE